MKSSTQPFCANRLRVTGLIAVMTFGLVLSSQAMGASQCKGLDTETCGETATCSWVNAYERKDGRKVKGFCRTKAKRLIKKTAQKETSKTQ